MTLHPDDLPSYRQERELHPSGSVDIVHTTPSEIILPNGLHRFMVEGRSKTWVSEDSITQVPGRLGFNRFEYRKPGIEVVYEDEYYDKEDMPGVFFGTELVRTEGRGRHIDASYNYTGELTEEGMEMGEGVVYGMLKYFLREHIEKARFGHTFDVEHWDQGKWTYVTIGKSGRSTWEDSEYIMHGGKVVYTLKGSGAIFL